MIEQTIAQVFVEAGKKLYGVHFKPEHVLVLKTRKDFEGDFTINVFPFTKEAGKQPEQLAAACGQYLQEHLEFVGAFNVIKGFLNLTVSNHYWVDFLLSDATNPDYGFHRSSEEEKIVIEYSSPNTNKPLHLGHVRNNLLGYSIAEILKANGRQVVKVNLVNDRGIHICKSMLAWQLSGLEETPQSTSTKGDHLVGKYYVQFDQRYKAEVEELVERGFDRETAKQKAPSMVAAQQMLKQWEEQDEAVITLWKKMNQWVYDGFEETYGRLGVDFDQVNYESETYLLGKQIVEKGLQSGALLQKEDGSVWADLTGDGLDEKLLLRSDGTSVYMTQDLGTAEQRYADFKASKMLYVVGNEQNYHFDALKFILKKMGYDWAGSIEHISYGMIELPEGRMKSREGTVVDADDLMKEMVFTAQKTSVELGKMDGLSPEEAASLYEMVGMGALKYFILKVDPKKKMLFDPKESIDFNGNTGPFIQYTHARIRSLLRKAAERHLDGTRLNTEEIHLSEVEKNIIRKIAEFPAIVRQAGDIFSPALIANYTYELVKEYNQFYQSVPVFKEENEHQLIFRLRISAVVGELVKRSMRLLGIDVPEQM